MVYEFECYGNMTASPDPQRREVLVHIFLYALAGLSVTFLYTNVCLTTDLQTWTN